MKQYLGLGAALLLLLGVSAPSTEAGPGSLIAGVCEIQLEVTTQTTGWREITTPFAGTCETTDGPADGWFDGEFGPFPEYGCTDGFGDGTANFVLDFDGGLSPGWGSTELQVVNNGGVVEVTFFQLGNPHIVGWGEFVQDPDDTVSCLSGGTTVTWTGVLAFEDPVVEAP